MQPADSALPAFKECKNNGFTQILSITVHGPVFTASYMVNFYNLFMTFPQ